LAVGHVRGEHRRRVLLGYLATRLQERLPLSAYRRPLLGTGLCGALTTFSTMQLELLRMLDHRRAGLAFGYAAASVAAGFWGYHTATTRRTATGSSRCAATCRS
jgi:CrcB protein